jgi:acetyl esterase
LNESARELEARSKLDPAIRAFIRIVSADFARHPPLISSSPARQRAVAENVRAQWALGGPAMAQTLDFRVPYGPRQVRVRIYRPFSVSPLPALIYLHGGGWTMFSIDTHDRVMREYATRARCVVIGIDYSLAPEARFPTALDDVMHIVRWAGEQAQQLGIRADRLALGGDSAGGNLTLAACLGLRDGGDRHRVHAMLLNYAALDVACSAESIACYGGPDYMLGGEEMAQFWRNYMRDAQDAENPLVCPARAQDLHALPPAFFTIAECDILAQQNTLMAERLRAAGVAVEAIVYRGASHSFLEAVSIAKISRRALDDASRWLRATLAGTSAQPRNG